MGGPASAELTRGTYRVEIRDKDTGEIVDGCDLKNQIVKGSFNRTLDGISEAELLVTLPQDNCKSSGHCDCAVTERQHELAITRLDRPNEPAWVGPITRTVDDPFQGNIAYRAKDRLFWAEGAQALRALAHEAPNEVDIVQVFRELLDLIDAYQDTGLDSYFEGRFGQLPPLGELLVEIGIEPGDSLYSSMLGLAKNSLDWTVVGPHLYWGSPTIPVKDGPTITPIHFSSPPIIDRDANNTTSQVVVTGAGGIRGVFPEVDTDTGRGRRSLFVSDNTLNTQTEANALAQTIYEQNSQPNDFIITGDGSVSDSFPLPLHELIPGRLFPIRAEGQCLESDEDLVQLFNVVVEFESLGTPLLIRETRVALDFRPVRAAGSAQRQSG